MGLQDRDYTRESWRGGSPFGGGSWGAGSASPLTGGGQSITVMLIIINVAVFLIDLTLSGGGGNRSVMADWCEVRADTLIKPWAWYRWLTYGFVHSIDDIWHLAFNMLGLFIFGRSVESRIGRSEYLRFFLIAVVLGGVVASLRWTAAAIVAGEAISAVNVGTIGASGAVMAITILFAFYFPHATILLMLIIPVKAWLVAVLFVAMNVLGMIGGGGHVAYEVHLAGAAWAALYHLRGWQLQSFQFAGLSGLAGSLTKSKPRLKLHDPEKKLAQQEAEVDRILDKIQASGIDSLTSAERKTLERHSRLKRQQRT